MTLVERCTDVQGQIRRYEKLRKAQGEAEAYATRLKMLKDRSDVLRPLMATRRALLGKAVAHEVPAEPATRAAALLAKVRTDYVRDPGTIVASHALGNAPRILQALSDRLRTMLESAWHGYVDSRHVEVSEHLLGILDQIPGLQASISEIRASQGRITRLRGTLPSDAAAVDALDAAVAQLRVLWQKLAGDGVPDQVMQFIRAAAAGGASLEMLTDEVEAWLTVRGVRSAFNVVVRRPS